METLQDRDTTLVAASLYAPVEVTRSVGAWGLGDAGYVTETYPSPTSMASAERPLGFAVALAGADAVESTVQVVPTGMEQ